jgi:hypothetical protein
LEGYIANRIGLDNMLQIIKYAASSIAKKKINGEESEKEKVAPFKKYLNIGEYTAQPEQDGNPKS